uniref:Uncharacterized protein n=1 Tax=Anguilla anguilla TaxID=7936 RepID=A0A0E9QHP4_ANGAN
MLAQLTDKLCVNIHICKGGYHLNVQGSTGVLAFTPCMNQFSSWQHNIHHTASLVAWLCHSVHPNVQYD